MYICTRYLVHRQARHLVQKQRQEIPSELVPKIQPSYRTQRDRGRLLARVRVFGNNCDKGHNHVQNLDHITCYVHVVDQHELLQVNVAKRHPEAKCKDIEDQRDHHKHQPALYDCASLAEGLESLLLRLLSQLEVHALGRFPRLSIEALDGSNEYRYRRLRRVLFDPREPNEDHG